MLYFDKFVFPIIFEQIFKRYDKKKITKKLETHTHADVKNIRSLEYETNYKQKQK